MPTLVADNPGLLKVLLSDSDIATPLWQPTAYWRNYTGRITREIEKEGLREFRSNHLICKGYALGGTPEPIPPVSPWKRTIWNALLKAPVFNRVVGAFRHQMKAEHSHLRRAEIRFARILMDKLAEQWPELRIPRGLGHGHPDDAFEWRGHTVTASWVEHLCRIADFYTLVPASEVEAILEIGPGIGQSTLAHTALNPNLKTIVNVDIVPILYVSTQYLNSTGEFECIDYLTTREEPSISVGSGGTKPRLYQVPPWQIPLLKGRFDYFFNAFSFQEMEIEVCQNYARHLLPLVVKGMLLHSTIAGHKLGAGGQQEAVNMDFLADLFTEKFPNRRSVPGHTTQHFGLDVESIQLLN
jgi:putative sugar O-methyltransferase